MSKDGVNLALESTSASKDYHSFLQEEALVIDN